MDDNKAETITFSELPAEREMRLAIQDRMMWGDSPTLFVRMLTRRMYRDLFGKETQSLVEVEDA
jgi:hypothetical protein